MQELRAKSISTAYTGDEWWELGLPSFCRCLVDQRAKLKQDHAADLEWEASQLSEARRHAQNRANYIDELNSEINDLKDELLKASAREEALHAVIHRYRWG